MGLRLETRMTRWSNRAIERARGRWILVLDADEVLDPDSAPKIENLIGRVHEIIDAAILSGGGRLNKTGIRINHSFSSNREERRKNHSHIQILKEERSPPTRAAWCALELISSSAEVSPRLCRSRVVPSTRRRTGTGGMHHLTITLQPKYEST